MIELPEGAQIVEACEHGNPMNMACKLCRRVGDPNVVVGQATADPKYAERAELLAIAFGLLESVDPKKAGEDWVASYEEWKERFVLVDPRGTVV
jgi:hypothetical protein